MPTLNENAFTFVSHALPEDTFTVVRFSGDEGLSTLYSFEVLLVSEKEDIDLTVVLQNPATFTIKGSISGSEDLPFHGILSGFEQMHQADTYFFYRAELRPKLWWLTLTQHNQVFLDKKVDQFLGEVLKDGGLSPGLDFAFQFQGKYQPWEYICQYGESHFGFVSRWMEREGAYYWFEQGGQSEKMIASDTLIAHAPLPGHETFLYSPPSGLDAADAGKVIKRFTLKQAPLPKNVLLKDYNYMKPSLDLEGKASVQDKGRGEIYLYGENFANKSEGDRLARVRAEEFRCREKVFHGLSSIPAIRPGYLFTLNRHFRGEFNQQYLTTTVRHEGSQERYLLSGLGIRNLENVEGLFYRNTFECIPSSTQYRPARITPKPRMAGTLSAKVDAAGSGKYAELDKHGRYKVIMPFDLSGRGSGKASAYLRMMQPYAGEGMGFHAPLHKGTEVLISFIEADPDRPVISGAVPNPETPSPVNDANQTQVRLVSGGGNVMHMEDETGKERMLMHTPSANTFIRLGAPNDPDTSPSKKDDEQDERLDDLEEQQEEQEEKNEATETKDDAQDERLDDLEEKQEEQEDKNEEQEEKDEKQDERIEELETEWGIRLFTDKLLKVQAGGENTIILGEVTETIVGAEIGIKLITVDEFIAGLKSELMLGGQGSYHFPTHWLLKGSEEKVTEEHLEVIAAKQAALGTYNVTHGEHGHVTATVTGVSAEVSQAVANSNEVAGEINRATGDVMTVVGAKTEALANRIHAVGDNVKALGNTVRSAGNELSNAGVKLQNVGSDIGNSGSRIRNAGTSIKDAGMIMRDAPVIMDN